MICMFMPYSDFIMGKPYKVNRLVGSGGAREQWISRRVVPVGITTGHSRVFLECILSIFHRR